jgi:hypothetical protein
MTSSGSAPVASQMSDAKKQQMRVDFNAKTLDDKDSNLPRQWLESSPSQASSPPYEDIETEDSNKDDQDDDRMS